MWGLSLRISALGFVSRGSCLICSEPSGLRKSGLPAPVLEFRGLEFRGLEVWV